MFIKFTLLVFAILLYASGFSYTGPKDFFAQKKISYTQLEHPDFKEYYELWIEQPVDHFNKKPGTFLQKVALGFNNMLAPVVLETQGYALGKTYKPYFIKECNVLDVEHRYYGNSTLNDSGFTYLTIKQAAHDYHRVRILFDSLFTGKWLSTGISKGGQTALAYRLFYPNDVDATLAYVTPVRRDQNDKRLSEKLNELSKTVAGKQVAAFQQLAFRHKQTLLPLFKSYIDQKGYDFGTMSYERVFDYMLLEYPFSFFQNCHSTSVIPDSTSLHSQSFMIQLTGVVPPIMYTVSFRKKLQPSFYMFYHELGYYEYDIRPFKSWLKAPDYSNAFFAPPTAMFDPQYMQQLNDFMNSGKASHIIFIYGENDPYTALQADVSHCKDCLKYIVKNGCHKSRIQHLDPLQREELFSNLSKWLNWEIHN